MRYLRNCFTDFDRILLPRCILATATSITGQGIHWGIIPQKVSISFYSLPENSEKSAVNRFHAKLVKYSNFQDIFANVDPFLMKFHVARHIHLTKLMSDQNIENFKIQVDRWRPTRKLRKISIYFYSLPKKFYNMFAIV